MGAIVQFNLQTLTDACRPGGASVLTATTELAPAAGPHAGVAPARYVRGSQGTYAFETRFVDLGDGSPRAVATVVIDSKSSQLNRIEAALSAAITDGEEPVSKTPRIELTYRGQAPTTCLDLPHRAFDGHIRAGTIDAEPVTDHPSYRAARDSTAANARALLELSPISLVLGAWDSTRKSHQVRFRSSLVGEIIGVLSDQGLNGTDIAPRGGARSDQIAPSVRVSPEDMETLLSAQESELSTNNLEKIRKEMGKAKKGGVISASGLGLGSIPPSLDGLGLVSCQRIIRSHVLSFAALRQVRFDLGAAGDASARALLAALAVNGLARSYAELILRANCDLVETAPPVVKLDGRYGASTEIDFPSIEEADALLEQAISEASAAGVRWEGQIFEVAGNPIISGGIVADADEG